MGHIKISATRAERTPVEWLPIGSQIGNLVNTWAGRTDIVAYVGPGAGGSSPACFNPPVAEVEVNVNAAFGDGIIPSQIGDLNDRDTLFNYPKAAGAIFHEALHARYSRMNLNELSKSLNPNEFQSFMLLEETRIEALGVENYPTNRLFLRATALDIVLTDISENIQKADTVRSVAGIAALISARVDAGSLDAEDAEPINSLVIDFLGEDTFNKLQEVWRKFQKHEIHHVAGPLVDLTREWEKIITEAMKDRGEEDKPNSAPKELKAIMKEIMEAIEQAAEEISVKVLSEAQDQQQSEEWKEEAQTRADAAKQQREHKNVAVEVFARTTGEVEDIRGTHSRLVEVRKPNANERAAAVKIARLLEKAKYRERDEHDIQSILPPGRLRTRSIVQNAAYRAQGSMTMAEPWRRTVRRHTDDPTLNIGVMVDISGSMGDAMQPMAVTAWAMSEAARRVQARAAMVYFGQDVFPTLKPGQHLDQVNVYSAADGTERFNKAFKALDGSLNLLHGTGARLLVVVSDGCYTEEERERAVFWMKECDRNGVAVLWIPFCDAPQIYNARRIVDGTSAVLLSEVKDPAEAALLIGNAAAKALSNIGSRNAA